MSKKLNNIKNILRKDLKKGANDIAKDKVLNIRMEGDLHDAIDKKADELITTKSKLVRAVMVDFLED